MATKKKTDDEEINEEAAKLAGETEDAPAPTVGVRPLSEIKCVSTMRVTRPPEQAFDLAGDYIPAPDAEEIVRALIGHWQEFSFIGPDEVIVAWKHKGGKSGGHPVLAKTQLITTGVVGYFAPPGVNWMITLAWDNTALFQPEMYEALLYHELRHCDIAGDDERPAVQGHEIEMFASEVDRYGLWHPNFYRLHQAVSQVQLFDYDPVTGEILSPA